MSGVQMGTRFVGTYECDASDAYKQSYIDATAEDVILIKSPVGLPARVVRNAFVDGSQNGAKKRFACPYQCLLSCDAAKANYCIADALVNSAEGDMAHGFAMCGQNAYRVDKLVSVKDLMRELSGETVSESTRKPARSAESYAAVPVDCPPADSLKNPCLSPIISQYAPK